MKARIVDIASKMNNISEYWSPLTAVQVNTTDIKLAKFKGEFPLHLHQDTDEAFLVIQGRMILEVDGERIPLAEGEMAVVPKGTPHRPIATEECQVILMEEQGTEKTGDPVQEQNQRAGKK